MQEEVWLKLLELLKVSNRSWSFVFEVSERQNYLVLSLVLCFLLGLLLCANHCCITSVAPNTEPEPPLAKSSSYCCPDRWDPPLDHTLPLMKPLCCSMQALTSAIIVPSVHSFLPTMSRA